MGAAKDRLPVDPFEWETKLGVHYMKNARGKVIAVVRETSAETFIATYGGAPPETYTELEAARSAVSARYTGELDEAAALAAAKKKPEEKKDA